LRTIQRWEKDVVGDKRCFASRIPANKLTRAERDRVIDICCNERFYDMTPHEIVPILAEEGVYIASESTYYRILRSEGLLKHRSESKPGSKRHKPEELKATGPDQVWSWDITYLLTSIKGIYYYLYMFEDIWSRAIIGWDIYEEESAELASSLMARISIDRDVHGVRLHSDNGSPMKGATMLATLQRLNVLPSFSRPRVSNDNPYSESLFRTLKYTTGYPRSFDSIEDARKWVAGFVDWYNNEHRHSGIKYVTPMQRHNGIDKAILAKRKNTYVNAQLKHPERWSKKIRDWSWIKEVHLNPDAQKDSTKKAA
jgi:transposase InsO family protein